MTLPRSNVAKTATRKVLEFEIMMGIYGRAPKPALVRRRKTHLNLGQQVSR